MKRKIKKVLAMALAAMLSAAATNITSFAVSDPSVRTYGDINNDQQEDMTDFLMISLYLIGDIRLTNEQKTLADIDGNYAIDLLDLAYYKQYICHDPSISKDVIIGKTINFYIERPPEPEIFPQTDIVPLDGYEQPKMTIGLK